VRHRCSKGDTYLGEEGVPNSHGESTEGELKVALGKHGRLSSSHMLRHMSFVNGIFLIILHTSKKTLNV